MSNCVTGAEPGSSCPQNTRRVLWQPLVSSYHQAEKNSHTCSCMTLWKEEKNKGHGCDLIWTARIDFPSSIQFSWKYFCRQLQVLGGLGGLCLVLFTQLFLVLSHLWSEGLKLKIHLLWYSYHKKKLFIFTFFWKSLQVLGRVCTF